MRGTQKTADRQFEQPAAHLQYIRLSYSIMDNFWSPILRKVTEIGQNELKLICFNPKYPAFYFVFLKKSVTFSLTSALRFLLIGNSRPCLKTIVSFVLLMSDICRKSTKFAYVELCLTYISPPHGFFGGNVLMNGTIVLEKLSIKSGKRLFPNFTAHVEKSVNFLFLFA